MACLEWEIQKQAVTQKMSSAIHQSTSTLNYQLHKRTLRYSVLTVNEDGGEYDKLFHHHLYYGFLFDGEFAFVQIQSWGYFCCEDLSRTTRSIGEKKATLFIRSVKSSNECAIGQNLFVSHHYCVQWAPVIFHTPQKESYANRCELTLDDRLCVVLHCKLPFSRHVRS